jgi:membrane protein implicated in regulation of membrane protease activity
VTAAYLTAFIVGGIAVLSALLLADLGHGAGHDGLPFISLTSVSAALLGAGAGGLIATWAGLGALLSGLIALTTAVTLVLVLQGVLMPYLRRQESNSHRGRSSYVGLLGTVTLDVPVGSWGEVAFVDADGNRVRSRAITSEPGPLPKSTRVYIAEVDADYVHVVAIPEF